jgi:type I restriction enzyme M protein
VDLTARRAQAAEDARPFKDQAWEKSKQADAVRDRLAALKKAKPRDAAAVAAAEAELATLTKAARESAAKAEGIENAVYDLKAVNPHRKAAADTRTPPELLDLIDAKGREVAAALAELRGLEARSRGAALSD